MILKKERILSIDISTGSYRQFIDEIFGLVALKSPSYICVANVHMLVEAAKNSNFAAVVNNAAITTPDGVPLTWALKFLVGKKQDRVAGMDLLPDILSEAEKNKVSVFFYGGTTEMLDLTRSYLDNAYPNLEIVGMLSPPFRKLTEEEKQGHIAQVNNSGAQIIFVVLGCPKQEQWMSQVKNDIKGVMIGVGGALPVMIGAQKRAPLWAQKAGLEWLYRLLQEPKRLFKRYFTTNSYFIIIFIKALFRKKLGLR